MIMIFWGMDLLGSEALKLREEKGAADGGDARHTHGREMENRPNGPRRSAPLSSLGLPAPLAVSIAVAGTAVGGSRRRMATEVGGVIGRLAWGNPRRPRGQHGCPRGLLGLLGLLALLHS